MTLDKAVYIALLCGIIIGYLLRISYEINSKIKSEKEA